MSVKKNECARILSAMASKDIPDIFAWREKLQAFLDFLKANFPDVDGEVRPTGDITGSGLWAELVLWPVLYPAQLKEVLRVHLHGEGANLTGYLKSSQPLDISLIEESLYHMVTDVEFRKVLMECRRINTAMSLVNLIPSDRPKLHRTPIGVGVAGYEVGLFFWAKVGDVEQVQARFNVTPPELDKIVGAELIFGNGVKAEVVSAEVCPTNPKILILQARKL